MKLLKLMLQIFRGKTMIMLFGLVLTILSFGSSLGLLTLASWFLASCYLVATIDFNIFYPSSTIRGFAIARTALKYIQRLVTHKATFDVLTKLRIQIFASILPMSVDLNKMAAFKKQIAANTQGSSTSSSSNKIGVATSASPISNPTTTIRTTATRGTASTIETKAGATSHKTKPSLAHKPTKSSKATKLTTINDNELFDRLIKDIDNIDGYYVNVLIPFLGTLLLFIGFTIGLTFISPWLALVVGGSLTLFTLILPWIFYPLGKKMSQKIEFNSTQLRLAFLNYLELQFENLIFNKQAAKLERLTTLNEQLICEQLKRDKYVNLTTFIMQILLGTLITVTIFGASYLQVLEATDLRLPGLATIFIFLVVGAIELIVPLASLFVHLGQITASAANLEPLLANKQAAKVAQELIDIELEKQPYHEIDTSELYPAPTLLQELPTLDSVAISVRKVNFAYEKTPVISNLSYDFAAGKSYLISGDSGLGKTTFGNILLGLEVAFTGDLEFTLNYKNGRQVQLLANKSEQRPLCVTLSQRVHIFNDTVFDNLLLANPELTVEQAQAVLTQVGLDYLATDLYQMLGNGGRSLSGGEIRRIGIARVLLSQAKVIVLDEPTESIDSELEQVVLEQIFSHAKTNKATVILISHNRNNYSYCDYVLRMRKTNDQTVLEPLASNS